jgi:hypothetical protein
MMLRLAAWWSGGEIIAIRCHDGEEAFTIARNGLFDGRMAYRYWGLKIGAFRLFEDGRCGCVRAGDHYVVEWRRWP